MSTTPDNPSGIPYRAEVLRKSLHLLALVIPLGMHVLGKKYALMVLVPASALAIFLDWGRARHAGITRFIHGIFGFMMRPEEIPPAGSPVSINGATWVLVSAMMLTSIYPLHIAIACLVMFMVADAVAALIGRPFGRHRWGNSSKSIEGSAAFFVTALVLLTLFRIWGWPACAIVAGIATVLEVLPIRVNDNLSVPLLSGALLWGMEVWG